jgi:hypothetical protein
VSINKFLRQLLFALKALTVEVLTDANRVERSFAGRALRVFFISIVDLLADTHRFEFGQ